MDPGTDPGARTCPACGRRFICGIAAGERKCWCMTLPLVAEPTGEACLCRECLEYELKF